MRIPDHHVADYATKNDQDTLEFLRLFDEPEGASVLEVGSHDEPVANILTECGYKVVGVDLREYNNAGPELNYEYVRGDFCSLPRFVHAADAFDCVVSISAIEHFGLNTYGEGRRHEYYDVIAMRLVWNLLRPNGTCYVTVPFGTEHVEFIPHWRIYSLRTARSRLVQDFHIECLYPFVSGPGVRVFGRELPVGTWLNESQMEFVDMDDPHVSVMLKLRKRAVERKVANGR